MARANNGYERIQHKNHKDNQAYVFSDDAYVVERFYTRISVVYEPSTNRGEEWIRNRPDRPK